MPGTFGPLLDDRSIEVQLEAHFRALAELIDCRDETLAVLRDEADAIGVRLVVIGGVAVIRHGYERATSDRDVLVETADAPSLVERMVRSGDWEPTGTGTRFWINLTTRVVVDLRVTGGLLHPDRAARFPSLSSFELVEPVSGIPVIGFNDLLWLKLQAGRMRDLTDIMQLCKIHLGKIDPDRVLRRLLPEDTDLRDTLLDIIRKAPIEIANEQRLGQGLHPNYKQKPS